jgi:flavin-binding protein dodecin
MSSVVKVIEIISESPDSVEDAVQRGLERAARTLDGIKSAWISETKVNTSADGTISSWRVCMRVSFVLD